VPEGKTDSQSECRRLSLQGVRRRIEEKEEAVLAEEGQRVNWVGVVSFFFCLKRVNFSNARKSIF
jgi:hypothetical protein